jgi:hypothetical protein
VIAHDLQVSGTTRAGCTHWSTLIDPVRWRLEIAAAGWSVVMCQPGLACKERGRRTSVSYS